MKKLIAAALALLIGSSGYVIVDKTIENRVECLESKASSIEERLNTTVMPLETSTTFKPYTIYTTDTTTTTTIINEITTR